MMKKHLTMKSFQWHSSSLCKEAAVHYVKKPLWWFNHQEGLCSNWSFCDFFILYICKHSRHVDGAPMI